MKYRKYLVLAFIGSLFLPLLSAKTVEVPKEELDLGSITFIEAETEDELGFDTAGYLPEDFDPYSNEVAIEAINFIEEDSIQLGFDTSKYLPLNFDPYKK
ncbi:MAG: hypothetical protein AAGF96_22005 [Bacteroidota bacterium]